jgi:hypothetical protein
MFTNTSLESVAKTMMQSALKFNPAVSQEAFKPLMKQLKAWRDLAQKQAQGFQAVAAQTVDSFNAVKAPQAAFEAMKVSAENSVAVATQNLKAVTDLGFAQFHSDVDAIEKTHPAPEAFAIIGKSLKTAASTMENALQSVMKTGTEAVKKSRSD